MVVLMLLLLLLVTYKRYSLLGRRKPASLPPSLPPSGQYVCVQAFVDFLIVFLEHAGC